MNKKIIFLELLSIGLLLYFVIIWMPNPAFYPRKSLTFLIEAFGNQRVHNHVIPPEVLQKVKAITNCTKSKNYHKIQQRGQYWVLYNYVPAKRVFKCHESVTFTTHSDYTFLPSIGYLSDKWKGPISVAVYAPGNDLANAINSIVYLRNCAYPLIKELVSFHLYFDFSRIPREIPSSTDILNRSWNCSNGAPYWTQGRVYRVRRNLNYPINVGRNIAREMAQTYFFLAADIELYPSPNIISRFLTMIAENKPPLQNPNPRVFPIHVFEIEFLVRIPSTKSELAKLIETGKAVMFHQDFCPACHLIPQAAEWLKRREVDGLNVFSVVKRSGGLRQWEPSYIGTHADPFFDERFNLEGESDKMSQGYIFCVLDYDFMILDNAFLIHKPGIKRAKYNKKRWKLAKKTLNMTRTVILAELQLLYGEREGCITV